MTIEEAIKILDPETSAEAIAEIEYYGGFNGDVAKLEAVNEACRLAVKALRAQQETENNEPLTLDELRKMNGEPVWITPGGFWGLVIAHPGERVRLMDNGGDCVWADKEIELVGPVYRRKQHEEQKGE